MSCNHGPLNSNVDLILVARASTVFHYRSMTVPKRPKWNGWNVLASVFKNIVVAFSLSVPGIPEALAS